MRVSLCCISDPGVGRRERLDCPALRTADSNNIGDLGWKLLGKSKRERESSGEKNICY